MGYTWRRGIYSHVIVSNDKLFEHTLNKVVCVSFVSLPSFVWKSNIYPLLMLFSPFMLHAKILFLFPFLKALFLNEQLNHRGQI